MKPDPRREREMRELLEHGRIVRRIEDLDDELLEAIAKAKVPSRYRGLDEKLGLTDE